MRKSKRGKFLDFNKEIISGEIGSILGSAFGAYLSFLISKNASLIPAFSVAGSLIGNTSFFLSSKIYHKIKRKEFSIKGLFHDLEYYTPAAAPISIFIGYPALYLITRFFSQNGLSPFYSGAFGAILAFMIFLIIINIYRLILFHVFKKRI
jgi:hypothetical protein